MSTNAVSGKTAAGSSNDVNAALQARRNVLRGGVGTAVPILATFVSGPVGASTCMQPSGFVSVATFNSRNPNGLNNCTGSSPALWISASTWPTGVVKGNTTGDAGKGTGTKFNSIFSPALTIDYSLLCVLGKYADPDPQLVAAAGIAALWLNAKAGKTGTPAVFLPEGAVQLWANIGSHGGAYYPPAPGTPWTVAQTQAWLAKTWT